MNVAEVPHWRSARSDVVCDATTLLVKQLSIE